jgi:hypothetical protein
LSEEGEQELDRLREDAERLHEQMQNRTALTEAQFKQLAQEKLGRLPLALAQAGSYIKQAEITIIDYIEIFDGGEVAVKELLNYDEFPLHNQHEVVAVTWLLNVEALAETPEALILLDALSYTAESAIPRNLLFDYLKQEMRAQDKNIATEGISKAEEVNAKLTFNRAKKRLQDYSMTHFDKGTQHFAIHQILQEVMRWRLEGEARAIEVITRLAQVLLASTTVEAHKTMAGLLMSRSLIIHLDRVCHHFSCTSNRQLPASFRLLQIMLDKLGALHLQTGEAAAAKKAYEALCFIQQTSSLSGSYANYQI